MIKTFLPVKRYIHLFLRLFFLPSLIFNSFKKYRSYTFHVQVIYKRFIAVVVHGAFYPFPFSDWLLRSHKGIRGSATSLKSWTVK